MALTKKRKAILDFMIRKGQPVKKQEIVQEFDHWHFHNSSNHIGELLGRMVESKQIKRSKERGYYELNMNIEPQNQMSLNFN